MTVLALPDGWLERLAKGPYDATSLRAWLASRWAILFSHPEDFAQEQLEMDRWISIVSRSFGERGVAPVALSRPGRDPGQGWLGRLAAAGRESVAVLTLDPPSSGAVADPAAAELRARIAGSGPRLAMILDPALRCRRTLSYRLPAELPSPLDLIGWAASLRKRDRLEESPRETWWEPALPISSGWARNARYAVAQAGRG